MIVTCEECETKFLVASEALGIEGRKVRCGSCGHVWLQMPPTLEQQEKEKEIAVSQAENLKKAVAEKAQGIEPSLPTVAIIAPPRWMRAAVVLLAVANVAAFIICNKHTIGQTSFYDMIGQYDTSGVIISDASITAPKEETGKKVYYLDWSVQNTSKESRQYPYDRVRQLDKDLNVLNKGVIKKPGTLEPGQTIVMKDNRIENPDGKGKYLVLEIGNPYELSLR